MTLTKEQIEELKKQLHSQIKKMPENEKKEAEAQIENLSDEAIESMLEQQKSSQKPIFREIISGNIPRIIIVKLNKIYDKELSLESERSSQSEEELDSLEKELKKEVKKEEPKEIKEEKKEPIKKFPKRIP